MLLLNGLGWPECPRWYQGYLYVTDMHHNAVYRVENGALKTILQVQESPSGIGWLPDGRLIFVVMRERRFMTWSKGTLAEYADLRGVFHDDANDLSVGPDGRCYVTNIGGGWEAFYTGKPPLPTSIAVVSPDGVVSVATSDAITPNGVIQGSDGRLYVAESFAYRVSSYAIHGDGTLYDKRLVVQLPHGTVPDGICLDATGHVWIAAPTTKEVLGVGPTGRILHRLRVGHESTVPTACMLGGQDGKQLFVCVGDREASPSRRDPLPTDYSPRGRIEVFDVDTQHDGWP
jgi:sugar lactone lactonase YvrE